MLRRGMLAWRASLLYTEWSVGSKVPSGGIILKKRVGSIFRRWYGQIAGGERAREGVYSYGLDFTLNLEWVCHHREWALGIETV